MKLLLVIVALLLVVVINVKGESVTLLLNVTNNSGYINDDYNGGGCSQNGVGSNAGDMIEFGVGNGNAGSGYEIRTLFEFDTAIIPDDATVTNVELMVYLDLNYVSGGKTATVYQCNYGVFGDDDFQASVGNSEGYFLNSGSGIGAYHNKSLDNSYINLTGTTQYCIRDSDICADEQEYFRGNTAGKYQYINITYITESVVVDSSAPNLWYYFVNNSVLVDENLIIPFFVNDNTSVRVYSINGSSNVSAEKFDNDWKYFNNNPIDTVNNGVNDYSWMILNNDVWWMKNFSGSYDEYSSIKIYNGSVFTTTRHALNTIMDKNYTFKINATTGQQLFNFSLDGGSLSGVLLDNDEDHVWITTLDGGNTLFKNLRIDLSSVCNFTYPENEGAGLEMDQDENTIYVGSSSHTFYAINKADCTQKWNYTLDMVNAWTGTPKYYSGQVICGYYMSTTFTGIIALNSTNGVYLWNVTDLNNGFDVWDSQPSLDEDENFYLGSYGVGANSRFCKFDWWNGSYVWCNELGTNPSFLHAPALRNGYLLTVMSYTALNSPDAVFISYNKTNGKQICNYSLDNTESVYNNLAVVNDIVYFGGVNRSSANTGGNIWSINYTTCNLKWNYATKTGAYGGVSITDGLMYINTDDNLTIAFGKYMPSYLINESLGGGNYTITIYVNDSSGNVNHTVLNFQMVISANVSSNATSTSEGGGVNYVTDTEDIVYGSVGAFLTNFPYISAFAVIIMLLLIYQKKVRI